MFKKSIYDYLFNYLNDIIDYGFYQMACSVECSNTYVFTDFCIQPLSWLAVFVIYRVWVIYMQEESSIKTWKQRTFF